METLQAIFYLLLLSLRWLPRIMCILFAVFVTLFSFDVFGHEEGFWRTLAGFIIHNIPTIIIVTVLVLSWKWSWIGGISYICLGLVYIFAIPGDDKSSLISAPLFTIGGLFLIDWLLRNQVKKAQAAYWGEDQ